MRRPGSYRPGVDRPQRGGLEELMMDLETRRQAGFRFQNYQNFITDRPGRADERYRAKNSWCSIDESTGSMIYNVGEPASSSMSRRASTGSNDDRDSIASGWPGRGAPDEELASALGSASAAGDVSPLSPPPNLVGASPTTRRLEQLKGTAWPSPSLPPPPLSAGNASKQPVRARKVFTFDEENRTPAIPAGPISDLVIDTRRPLPRSPAVVSRQSPLYPGGAPESAGPMLPPHAAAFNHPKSGLSAAENAAFWGAASEGFDPLALSPSKPPRGIVMRAKKSLARKLTGLKGSVPLSPVRQSPEHGHDEEERLEDVANLKNNSGSGLEGPLPPPSPADSPDLPLVTQTRFGLAAISAQSAVVLMAAPTAALPATPDTSVPSPALDALSAKQQQAPGADKLTRTQFTTETAAEPQVLARGCISTSFSGAADEKTCVDTGFTGDGSSSGSGDGKAAASESRRSGSSGGGSASNVSPTACAAAGASGRAPRGALTERRSGENEMRPASRTPPYRRRGLRAAAATKSAASAAGGVSSPTRSTTVTPSARGPGGRGGKAANGSPAVSARGAAGKALALQRPRGLLAPAATASAYTNEPERTDAAAVSVPAAAAANATAASKLVKPVAEAAGVSGLSARAAKPTSALAAAAATALAKAVARGTPPVASHPPYTSVSPDRPGRLPHASSKHVKSSSCSVGRSLEPEHQRALRPPPAMTPPRHSGKVVVQAPAVKAQSTQGQQDQQQIVRAEGSVGEEPAREGVAGLYPERMYSVSEMTPPPRPRSMRRLVSASTATSKLLTAGSLGNSDHRRVRSEPVVRIDAKEPDLRGLAGGTPSAAEQRSLPTPLKAESTMNLHFWSRSIQRMASDSGKATERSESAAGKAEKTDSFSLPVTASSVVFKTAPAVRERVSSRQPVAAASPVRRSSSFKSPAERGGGSTSRSPVKAKGTSFATAAPAATSPVGRGATISPRRASACGKASAADEFSATAALVSPMRRTSTGSALGGASEFNNQGRLSTGTETESVTGKGLSTSKSRRRGSSNIFRRIRRWWVGLKQA